MATMRKNQFGDEIVIPSQGLVETEAQRNQFSDEIIIPPQESPRSLQPESRRFLRDEKIRESEELAAPPVPASMPAPVEGPAGKAATEWAATTSPARAVRFAPRGLVAIGGVVFFLLMLGSQARLSRCMPTNAQVYLDHEAHTYLAPPYVDDPGRYELATAELARKLKYRPDPECRDCGYFVQDYSLSGFVLEKLGILAPQPSRWNDDGSWNW